jgi:hypothetical protein
VTSNALDVEVARTQGEYSYQIVETNLNWCPFERKSAPDRETAARSINNVCRSQITESYQGKESPHYSRKRHPDGSLSLGKGISWCY